ncbi:MFS transporter [Ancylobacter sp. Lp-2]|uniref:MFS transporter n=1 Tax=Ancylobacter sp. Lp-2 TaxID=2881339 RepID=UPI001E5802B3|nr:MFS transporter [Ancylobacter sp. Lp-2]MCB4770395.1 MFS transporter [Ancylobacter sp. Lp-2]
MLKPPEPRPTHLRMLLPIVPCIAGYFFSYFLRNANLATADGISASLSLSTSVMGLLTAAYFFAATFIILPLGFFLDRYGPRILLTAEFLLSGTGALFFSRGETLFELIVWRAVMGVGMSGALITGVTVVAMTVPPHRRATWNGIILAGGGLGIIASGAPTVGFVAEWGWRPLFLLAGMACLLMACVALALLPRHAASPVHLRRRKLSDLKDVYRSPLFRRLAPLCSLTLACFFSLSGLWAIPIMRDVGGLSPAEISPLVFAYSVASFVGLLLAGSLSDYLQRRGASDQAVVVTLATLLIASQALLALGWGAGSYPLWIVIGSLGNIGTLIYPILTRHFDASLLGRAFSAFSLFNFIGTFTIQSSFGIVVEFGQRAMGGDDATQPYRLALSAMVALQLGALLWYHLRRPPAATRGEGEARA